MPKSGVYYKIQPHTNIKNKVRFFGEYVYPIYIMISFGHKSLNFKSRLFSNLLTEKYQVSYSMNNCCPTLQDVIIHEQLLINDIIKRAGTQFSLQLFKKEYSHFSTDISALMDRYCKDFLGHFSHQNLSEFNIRFIEKTLDILTCDIIIDHIRKTLRNPAEGNTFSPLLSYIRLFEFSMQRKSPNLPIITLFTLRDRSFLGELSAFLDNEGVAIEYIRQASLLVKGNTIADHDN